MRSIKNYNIKSLTLKLLFVSYVAFHTNITWAQTTEKSLWIVYTRCPATYGPEEKEYASRDPESELFAKRVCCRIVSDGTFIETAITTWSGPGCTGKEVFHEACQLTEAEQRLLKEEAWKLYNHLGKAENFTAVGGECSTLEVNGRIVDFFPKYLGINQPSNEVIAILYANSPIIIN